MKLWVGCLCVGIVLLIALVVVTCMLNKSKEKYLLLRNLGIAFRDLNYSMDYERVPRFDDDDESENKYDSHRYRRRSRNNN